MLELDCRGMNALHDLLTLIPLSEVKPTEKFDQ